MAPEPFFGLLEHPGADQGGDPDQIWAWCDQGGDPVQILAWRDQGGDPDPTLVKIKKNRLG